MRGRAVTGTRAERLAAAHLEGLGYRILARNWRRPQGELDLVADHCGVCVFVEVRSRTGDERGHALETVGAHKQAQVIRAARLFLQEEGSSASAFRFDVVAVTFPPTAGAPQLIHIEDAFRTP